jgi:Helix-turn-helix domain
MEPKEWATTPSKLAALESIRLSNQGNTSIVQCRRCELALLQFPITTFEASRYLDVYHPPARILQLRRRGLKILTLWKSVLTEAGVRHRVGLYVLKSEVANG